MIVYARYMLGVFCAKDQSQVDIQVDTIDIDSSWGFNTPI